jgi:hypothetical protein
VRPNALVQQQAQYNHRGEAASEKCLPAATFVRQQVVMLKVSALEAAGSRLAAVGFAR